MYQGVKVGLRAALLLAGLASSAFAEDGGGRWSGLYGGGNVGYAYGFPSAEFLSNSEGEPGTEIEKVFDVTPDGANPNNGNFIYARDGEVSGRADTEIDGFTGGIHIGYNAQINNVVFGIEGEYSWGELSGTGSATIDPKDGVLPIGSTLDTTAQSLAVSSSLDGLGSVRGRLGFTIGSFMLFGTGGVAWTDYSASAVSPEGFDNPNSPGVQNESGTFRWSDSLVGWVAGGGVEYQVSRNFSLRAEVVHYDFGDVNFGSEEELEDIGVDAGNIEAILGRQDVTINQLRIGASYHLN